MAQTDLSLPQMPTFVENRRRDRWWAQPLVTFLVFSAFIVYGTWAAFQGDHYWHAGPGHGEGVWHAQYLSPMYSPVLYRQETNAAGEALQRVAPAGHAWLGEWPDWLPKQMPLLGLAITPALLILWAPGLFRFTCYYYRGAYYKAFWADPLNCGVGEPGFRGKKYRGERAFPLILQNVHRYALYLAVIFIGILTYDAVISFIWLNDAGSRAFGMGWGSMVLTLNAFLLAGYTFGCHSMRHLIGGGLDILSRRPIRKKSYDCVSCLNRGHMRWAWASLLWVGFTDVYIRFIARGWDDAIFVLG